MKELHLIQARQAQPFIRLLKDSGAPVKLLARQAGLPLDAARKGKGVIGERSLWRFVEYAALREKREFLGYECALAHPVTADGVFAGMSLRLGPSLTAILGRFFTDAQKESSGSLYQLEPDGNSTWLRRTPIFLSEQASWQVEQYMIQVFIQIIRICAGPGWRPARIRVSSRPIPQPRPDEWKNIHFSWGHKATWIEISNETLALPPLLANREISESAGSAITNQIGELSIQALIDRQLEYGTVKLESAAEELGVSSATLKRKLRALNTSYSEIVENSRYDRARYLLKQTQNSIGEISDMLAYRHPSNFARAFKRISGVSPQAYRMRESG